VDAPLLAQVFGALLLLVYRERRGALPAIGAVGWPGWAVAILSTVVILTYLSALRLAAVADVMMNQASYFYSRRGRP
jgi:hypothetical protein